MEQFMKINTAVNGFVWGPVMLVLLVGTGVYLSIAVGFIQFTKIGYWWKNTIGKIFKKGEAGDGEITPLQLSLIHISEPTRPRPCRPYPRPLPPPSARATSRASRARSF